MYCRCNCTSVSQWEWVEGYEGKKWRKWWRQHRHDDVNIVTMLLNCICLRRSCWDSCCNQICKWIFKWSGMFCVGLKKMCNAPVLDNISQTKNLVSLKYSENIEKKKENVVLCIYRPNFVIFITFQPSSITFILLSVFFFFLLLSIRFLHTPNSLKIWVSLWVSELANPIFLEYETMDECVLQE